MSHAVIITHNKFLDYLSLDVILKLVEIFLKTGSELEKIWRLIGIICLTALAGCSQGRPCDELFEPPAQVLETAIDGAVSDDVVAYSDCPTTFWWELFGDQQLSGYIEIALRKNPSIQEAYANILYAAADADRVRSALFPYILWAADSSRQKLSETGLIPFNQQPVGVAGPAPGQIAATGGVSAVPVYFTQTETEFNLSYDFDLWGKNRNTWGAALDEVQASIADEAFVRLELSIAVASTYYQLQTDYKRFEVASRLVGLNDQFVALTQERTDNGLDSASQLEKTKSDLSSARLLSLEIERDIAVNENKLRAYLAGQFDEEIEPFSIEDKPLPKVPAPIDLPLHLVGYRPDIVAQLWAIESAGKQIEVAKAGFYPDFNINAFFGYQTIHWNKLFQWPSVFFNVDPAVSLPFFDGGRLQANLRGSEINYTRAVYEYNQKILNAVREVLDGLAVLRNAEKQYLEQKDKSSRQEEIFRLSSLRTENDLDSELNLIAAETAYLEVRNQELMLLGRSFQSALSLIKALGGGYEASWRIEG